MPRFLIPGARQRVSTIERREWNLFEEAQLAGLDTDSGDVALRLKYRTPPELCPAEDPSHVFKCASFDGSELLLTTQTEVLSVDPVSMEVRQRYSSPSFNDVHHAARIDGQVHVVSTGLDCLVVLGEDGQPERYRYVLDGDVWQRFSPEVDYRRVATTKPHAAHPNYVFRTDEGIWVTRFEQRDAICLDRPGLRIPIEVGMPHDGVLHDGDVWFTTVNGWLVHGDPATGDVTERIDLNAIDTRGQPLGWCRGLTFVDGLAYVGFTRLRQTTIRRNVSWVRHGFQRVGAHAQLPTRIAAYDVERRALVGEWDLESVNQNAVFSILPV